MLQVCRVVADVVCKEENGTFINFETLIRVVTSREGAVVQMLLVIAKVVNATKRGSASGDIFNIAVINCKGY